MSPRKKQRKKKLPVHPFARIFLRIGIGSISIGLFVFLLTFFPIVQVEVAYDMHQLTPKRTQELQPINTQFSILIPKINATARIIPNVDPYDSNVYQRALTKGVAHAKGTVYPGRIGNMFLFSHSSVNFYEAMRFNSVFYLLHKLEIGDTIDIYFEGNKITYTIFEKNTVNPNEVAYLTEKTSEKLLTLMTCWPPGTTTKRLIVRAKMLP